MSPKKSQKIIWKLKSYPKDYLKGSIVFMVLFLFPMYWLTHFLIFSIIFAFSIELLYGILLYTIWMITITILFVPLSASFLNKIHFSIKFTETNLYVKPELLIRTKKYSLSTLSQIEIILGHRYYFFRKQTSGLEMLVKLITENGETVKTFLFAKEFRMKLKKIIPPPAQIKQKLISLRDDFEIYFRNLKTIFPNIISLKEEDFPLSFWEWRSSKRKFSFLIFWFVYILFAGLFLFLIYDILFIDLT